MQYGFDPDLLFVRETKEIEVPKTRNDYKYIQSILSLCHDYYNTVYFLFFCGKVYPLVRIWGCTALYGTVTDYIEEQHAILIKEPHNRLALEFVNGSEKTWRNVSFNFSEKGLIALEKHLQTVVVPSEIFIEMDAPYFVVSESGKSGLNIIKNPPLNKYSFFKLLDPFNCYQEIRMYMGNVLTTINMMPYTTGGDKVVAQQHGFDDMSFRTAAPGQKKLNRKINRLRKKGELIPNDVI